MGDVSHNLSAPAGTEIRFFMPNELVVEERFNMRPYSSQQDTEDAAIEQLADSIEKNGQIDDVIVIPVVDKETGREIPVVIAGHRRRRAIALLNDKRSAASGGTAELLKVRVSIDRTEGDPVQKAFASNWDRKNPSPMDTAMKIWELRQEYGPNAGGTGKIGRYLGISKAGVTQHEKLLTKGCSADLQRKLHEGVLSMASALDIIGSVPEEKQARVVERAADIQKADKVKEVAESKAPKAKKEKRLAAAEKQTKVKTPAVKKAIKEVVPDAQVKVTYSHLKEILAEMDGPAYGHPDGAVRTWVRYTLDKFIPGDGSESTFLKKFDAMVENASMGTEGSEPKPEPKSAKAPKVKKAAKVKKTTKAKPVKKAKSKSKSKKSKATKREEPKQAADAGKPPKAAKKNK